MILFNIGKIGLFNYWLCFNIFWFDMIMVREVVYKVLFIILVKIIIFLNLRVKYCKIYIFYFDINEGINMFLVFKSYNVGWRFECLC